MNKLIGGIQQVGIGVPDAESAWAWYRKNLGLDVPVFNDEADAKLMTRYTKGEVRRRHAIMALNMAGGGGAEIWQYKNRIATKSVSVPRMGDLGIFAIKIKSPAIKHFQQDNYPENTLNQNPDGKSAFWLHDLYNNAIQVVEDDSWFQVKNKKIGGICGTIIGVSDMDRSMAFYRDILLLDEVTYDKTGTFLDFDAFEVTHQRFRRVLLGRKNNQGAFGKLLGNVQIELVQALDYEPQKIFKDRDWGDMGYIHLCFDTLDMTTFKNHCQTQGHLFTVDSADSFDMGEAAGRFAYLEDPDGTLIELVETHKVPILKKLGIYLNLKKRKSQNHLPDWMVATLGWSRVKD